MFWKSCSKCYHRVSMLDRFSDRHLIVIALIVQSCGPGDESMVGPPWPTPEDEEQSEDTSSSGEGSQEDEQSDGESESNSGVDPSSEDSENTIDEQCTEVSSLIDLQHIGRWFEQFFLGEWEECKITKVESEMSQFSILMDCGDDGLQHIKGSTLVDVDWSVIEGKVIRANYGFDFDGSGCGYSRLALKDLVSHQLLLGVFKGTHGCLYGKGNVSDFDISDVVDIAPFDITVVTNLCEIPKFDDNADESECSVQIPIGFNLSWAESGEQSLGPDQHQSVLKIDEDLSYRFILGPSYTRHRCGLHDRLPKVQFMIIQE